MLTVSEVIQAFTYNGKAEREEVERAEHEAQVELLNEAQKWERVGLYETAQNRNR